MWDTFVCIRIKYPYKVTPYFPIDRMTNFHGPKTLPKELCNARSKMACDSITLLAARIHTYCLVTNIP